MAAPELEQPDAAADMDADQARHLIRTILTGGTDEGLFVRQALLNAFIGERLWTEMEDDGRAIALGQRALCLLNAHEAARRAREAHERFQRRLVGLGPVLQPLAA